MSVCAWRRTIPGLVLLCVVTSLIGCAFDPNLPATPANADAEAASDFQPITDIPIPAGARLDVENSIVLGSLDRWTGRLVLILDQSVSESFAFFQQQMRSFGWQPITRVQAKTSVLTFLRGDRGATILIESRVLGGSTVAVTISLRHPEQN
jgi:hypothetical protein